VLANLGFSRKANSIVGDVTRRGYLAVRKTSEYWLGVDGETNRLISGRAYEWP
jgi:hypothetical protein